MALSCKRSESEVEKNQSQEANYLHISHTRTDMNPNVDSSISKINFMDFDMLWLGGDLAQATSLDKETISHIDSIFDFGSINTLWTLGNHDYSNLDLVEEFTKRPPYFAVHKNGLTFINLDTQDSLSNVLGNQKSLFDMVTDTIKESTHLILLHHKLIWMYNNPDLEPSIPLTSNAKFGDCFYCLNPNNFYTEIYPKLIELKKRGIEVLCIGGDIGTKAKEFEYVTAEGIHFLASGIYFKADEKKALLFHHDITNKKLSWEFKLLSKL